MKNKFHLLLGGLLMAMVLFLILGAAAPAPVQRNQWSTNVQGQPIIGDWTYSNSVAGSYSNFLQFSGQGITSLAPGPRQLWKLYGWGNNGPVGDSVLDWSGSSSHLSTNGGISIASDSIDLNPNGSALFTGSISNTPLTASRAVVTDANKVLTSATGTPTGSKFLRDDNTYAVPAGTGLTSSSLRTNLAVYSDGNTNLVSAGTNGVAYAASTITLNFSGAIYQILSLTNDTTFTNANQQGGSAIACKVTAPSTNVSLTFPANWSFLGNGVPATITSNKVGIISITAFGANPSDIVAVWAVQP